MSVNDSVVKEATNDDVLAERWREITALSSSRGLITSIADEAVANPDSPLVPRPQPLRPAAERRWWRRRAAEKEQAAFDRECGSPLIRVCNGVIAFALDQGASEVSIRRSGSVLRAAFQDQAGDEQELTLPGSLFEKMTARYLIMASGPTAKNGFFNRVPIRWSNKNYKVSVVITQDEEGAVLTLRFERG